MPCLFYLFLFRYFLLGFSFFVAFEMATAARPTAAAPARSAFPGFSLTVSVTPFPEYNKSSRLLPPSSMINFLLSFISNPPVNIHLHVHYNTVVHVSQELLFDAPSIFTFVLLDFIPPIWQYILVDFELNNYKHFAEIQYYITKGN